MVKVEVLCPNGHRIQIDAANNTKLIQVLEEVCAKKGFTPPEDYCLKHGNKVLDLTLTHRFAGLPNLAKLELVKSETDRREETIVTIALQTPARGRLLGDFSPSTNLWDVLMYWENKEGSNCKDTLACVTEDNRHPVCVSMSDEIVGALALQHTTLRQLGLTSGRAVIRFLHRAVDEQKLSDIKEQILKDLSRKKKLKESAASKQSQDTSNNKTTVQSTSKLAPSGGQATNVEPSSTSSTVLQWNAGSDVDVPAQSTSDKPGESNRGAQPMADEEPFIPWSLPSFFQVQPNREERQRETEKETRQHKRFREVMDAQPTVEFKFPEETKGQDLYNNDLNAVDKTEYEPCDREAMLYHMQELSEIMRCTTHEDVGDEFFEVTESDMRTLWEDTQRKLHDSQEQPLMTKALRMAQKLDQMTRYERVAVRIQFPDQLVLQGLFRPRETVHVLHQFVAQHLRDKDMPFQLYTTPPKCVLADKSSNMIEAELAPMSVVYFGCELSGPYLSDTTTASQSSVLSANAILMKHMQSKAEGQAEVKAKRSVEKRLPRSSGGTSGTSGLPKWFKAGKK